MAIDEIDPAVFTSQNASSQPDLLMSAVLHLMSHYTANVGDTGACIKLASVIERHLKALANLPDLAPVLRATCQQLSDQWATVVERGMPRPAKLTLFTKLISATRSH